MHQFLVSSSWKINKPLKTNAALVQFPLLCIDILWWNIQLTQWYIVFLLIWCMTEFTINIVVQPRVRWILSKHWLYGMMDMRLEWELESGSWVQQRWMCRMQTWKGVCWGFTGRIRHGQNRTQKSGISASISAKLRIQIYCKAFQKKHWPISVLLATFNNPRRDSNPQPPDAAHRVEVWRHNH